MDPIINHKQGRRTKKYLKGRVAKEWELAYLAGLFDGEGSISVYPKIRKKEGDVRCYPVIAIGMSDKEGLQLFSEVLGGSPVTGEKRKNPRPNHKPMFECRAIGAKAHQILGRLLPYLRVKKHRAEVVYNKGPVWLEKEKWHGSYNHHS